MTTLPSFLGNFSKKEISHKIFTDLQLDNILSPSARKILAFPCNGKEILRRQEFFASIMENEEAFSLVKDAISALNSYQTSFGVWESSKIPAEKSHLFVNLLEEYLKVCEVLCTLAPLGDICREIADYFSSDEMIGRRTKMAQSVRNSKIILSKINKYVFTYGEYAQVSKFNAPSTYYEEGTRLFAKLGLTTPEKRRMNVKLHITLSDGVTELFGKEYYRISAMLSPYQDINFRALFPYIRELNFYKEMRSFYLNAADYNLQRCFPRVSSEKRYISKDLYDISLIGKECKNIVPNDTWFDKNSIFFFLTGANGGGKTTYLRSVAINLILFLGGMPIFAKEAEIYPFSSIYTHFPKDERFASTGRLHEEVMRTKAILTECDNDAFILFNETFSGTDDKKGYELLLETANEIAERKIGGLYVTHFHEIRDTSFPILGVEVDKSDENKRTYKITQKTGDRSSFAHDILVKYRLDKASLEERG
ncbi:MAG: hypothetical protein IJX51_00090 [Clostridia bacterium]|nr:hypothetical protein [Clostridia bacterium]